MGDPGQRYAQTHHGRLQGAAAIPKSAATPKPIATFEATIPTIQSAILIGSDGAQVKLQVPETNVDEVQKLITLGRNIPLYISVFAQEG